MKNTLNWFEIFVNDLERAQPFYEQVLATRLKRNGDYDGSPMAIFLAEGQSTGALVKHPKRKPGGEGMVPYFNCNGALDACLARVEQAGGRVLQPKTDIGPPGFIALVADPDGNTIGLHAERQ